MISQLAKLEEGFGYSRRPQPRSKDVLIIWQVVFREQTFYAVVVAGQRLASDHGPDLVVLTIECCHVVRIRFRA